MANAIELTISDVKRFKQCRTAWNYNSALRMNLVPKNRAPHFLFGDYFHQALEKYYTGHENPAEYFEEIAFPKLEELKDANLNMLNFEAILQEFLLGPVLLAVYKRWASKHDDFTVKATEQRLSVRLNDKVPSHFYSFKFDAVVERNGELWLHDYKTTQVLPQDFQFLVIDDQAVAYQAAYELATGNKVAGMMYTYIRKYHPAVPELLKNGQLSQRKNIVTTLDVYMQALEDNNLNPSNYLEMLEMIREKEGHDYISRGYVRANDKQKSAKMVELARLAEEMGNENVFIYPSPDKRTCPVCDYRNACLIRSIGSDDSIELQMNFQQAEPR